MVNVGVCVSVWGGAHITVVMPMISWLTKPWSVKAPAADWNRWDNSHRLRSKTHCSQLSIKYVALCTNALCAQSRSFIRCFVSLWHTPRFRLYRGFMGQFYCWSEEAKNISFHVVTGKKIIPLKISLKKNSTGFMRIQVKNQIIVLQKKWFSVNKS